MDKRAARGGQTGDTLELAIQRATTGDNRPLYARLARGSGLPGLRPNAALLEQFARACSARGASVDRVIVRMATLHADEAPGATELEFLPMCGVAAAGARGASDAAARSKMLEILHDAAEDLRFRVRDAVVDALATIGERGDPQLVFQLAPWMDGFFQASAVLRALARPGWLGRVSDATPVLEILEAAFVLARDAERAVQRYPGYKALVEALGSSPGAIAARFGVPVLDWLEGHCTVKEPVLRDAILRNLDGPRLAGRFGAEIARVRRALEASAPPRRDPTTYVGTTRGRGRKRRRPN